MKIKTTTTTGLKNKLKYSQCQREYPYSRAKPRGITLKNNSVKD